MPCDVVEITREDYGDGKGRCSVLGSRYTTFGKVSLEETVTDVIEKYRQNGWTAAKTSVGSSGYAVITMTKPG